MCADQKTKEPEDTKTNGLVSLRRISYFLLGCNLFCLIVLIGPDSTILAANAKLDIPLIESTISARVFIIFFPLCMIFVNIYAQLMINSMLRKVCETNKALPRTMDSAVTEITGSKLVSLLIFYWLTPITLIAMAWKSLPRPESFFIIPIVITYTIGIILTRIWQVRICMNLTRYFILAWIAVSSIITAFFYLQYYVYPDHLHAIRPVDLVKADLAKSDLRNVHLAKASMDHVSLNEANLESANLAEAELKHAKLVDTILKYTTLNWAVLENADMDHADLRFAVLANAKMTGAQLKHADLSDAIMYFVDSKGVDMTDAVLTDAKLDVAIMPGAILKGATMIEADLRDSVLTGANLSNIKAFSVNLSIANLTRAKLIDAQLDDALIRGADLKGAKLNNASMMNANLICSNLKGADLTDAKLEFAKLMKADLENTILLRTNLYHADLRKVRNLDCSKLKTAANWTESYRDDALACDDQIPAMEFEDNEDKIECSAIEIEVKNQIKYDWDNKYGTE
jgi:uncharacterized protein YjbI with pentapeptide repeats